MECLFDLAKYSPTDYPSFEVSKIAQKIKMHQKRSYSYVYDTDNYLMAPNTCEDTLKLNECCQLNHRYKKRLTDIIDSACSMMETSTSGSGTATAIQPLYLVRMLEIKCENLKLQSDRLSKALHNSGVRSSEMQHDNERLYCDINALYATICASEIQCAHLRLVNDSHAVSIATQMEKVQKLRHLLEVKEREKTKIMSENEEKIKLVQSTLAGNYPQ